MKSVDLVKLATATLETAKKYEGITEITLRDKKDAVMATCTAYPEDTLEDVLQRTKAGA